jgi:hypothetical protein
MNWGNCPLCKEEMKSPYTFIDSKGEWHTAHKYCCNQLSRQIEDKYLNKDNLALHVGGKVR